MVLLMYMQIADSIILGVVTSVEKNVYRIATDTGEEVLLIEEDYGDIIMLQLYVDGQYLDEYQQVEHYVS